MPQIAFPIVADHQAAKLNFTQLRTMPNIEFSQDISIE